MLIRTRTRAEAVGAASTHAATIVYYMFPIQHGACRLWAIRFMNARTEFAWYWGAPMYWYLCIGNMPYDLMMIHIRCRTLSCQASQVASASCLWHPSLFAPTATKKLVFSTRQATGKFFHLCLINSIISTCYTCKYCATICCLLLHCLTDFLC